MGGLLESRCLGWRSPVLSFGGASAPRTYRIFILGSAPASEPRRRERAGLGGGMACLVVEGPLGACQYGEEGLFEP